MRLEQLTQELKVVREEFFKLSKDKLTTEELELIEDITGNKELTKDTVTNLLFSTYSHLMLVAEGRSEFNIEFIEQINILVAKLHNIEHEKTIKMLNKNRELRKENKKSKCILKNINKKNR